MVGEIPSAGRGDVEGGLGRLPNGPGAAAILAAGIGSLVLGLLSFASDAWPGVRAAFIIWTPSGPLSGVSTGTLAAWLLAWLLLSVLWRGRSVRLGRVNAAAFAMLAAGLLLTFPPFVDLLQSQ